MAVNQAMWLRKILVDMRYKQYEPTEVLVDNMLAIAIAKNLVCHNKKKHMKVKFHAIKDDEQEKEVKLVHCLTKFQLANTFIRPFQKQSLSS